MSNGMLKSSFFLFLIVFFGFAEPAIGQTVGRKKASMELLSYNPIKDDGELMLEMDVRMADCISHLEIACETIKKPLVVEVTEENYYLSEDGEEQIFMKVSIGNMKDILKKNKEVSTTLTVYSKSGKPIFTRQILLVKDSLIASIARN